MWVKICGNTNLADALLAVNAGADAVGFVFGESKRRVTPEQVAAITLELPGTVEKIGVIVNEMPQRVAEIVRIAGLTGVQLQGDETPEFTGELRRLGLRRLVKTVQASAGVDMLASRIAQYRSVVDSILLDSGSPAERGGTGKRFAWKDAAVQLANVSVPVIVAGGLNPENVEEAIMTLRPWGVDVVTGVEREPGKKDPEKIAAFINAARRADKNVLAL
jgi:phosphoribosylanthranilate isomerase